MTTSLSSLEKGNVNGHPRVSFAWDKVDFTIKSGKKLVSSASGSASSGEVIALMGPSGAGKSTLLDILAGRKKPTSGQITVNGQTRFDMKKLSSFVEQDDALMGVLTVRETITFAAKLSLPLSVESEELKRNVDDTIATLGLAEVQNNMIGTPIQRGISGGQRRRVTLGSSMVSQPQILLADEPTSGLDSLAAREVVACLKRYAAERSAVVIVSIHQPNYETLSLFDRVIYLAAGHTVYNGAPSALDRFLEANERPCPKHVNPSDYLMEMLNLDFASDEPKLDIERVAHNWARDHSNDGVPTHVGELPTISRDENKARRSLFVTGVLSHRLLLNYSRNLLAYGIRLGMYLGMGFLVATIWVHLPKTSAAINDRLSVLFYAVAFLAFMSVAGIPSYLEERAVFVRERKNGLYGPIPFVLANSLISAPFMFVCSLGFTLIAYWAVPLKSGAGPFFKFLVTLWVTVYTAEAQSVLVATVVPIFVAALAITAFVNGLLMSVQGYFIRINTMPAFWRYTFHQIDFENYSFGLLTTNEFRNTIWPCETLANGACSCAFPSSLANQCALKGEDVLNFLGYGGISWGLWFGILVLIALAYRLMILGFLYVRRN